jgi:hypothetical protein
MTEPMIDCDDNQEFPTFDVSDAALERAAAESSLGYTLGACTGLSVCPG